LVQRGDIDDFGPSLIKQVSFELPHSPETLCILIRCLSAPYFESFLP